MPIHSLLEKTKDPLLSISRFEVIHLEGLVEWLIKENDCKPIEAHHFSIAILERLKEAYSVKKDYRLSFIWQIIHKFTQQELSKAHKSMEKNFGLTEPLFNDLLLQLQKGEDRLFEQLFLSHFEDCLLYLKRNFGASQEDAYDATMETMLVFFKRLKEGKISYGNLRFLFTQMAGQIYLKWIKKENKRNQLEDTFMLDAPIDLEEENLKILDKAWNILGENCRKLLKQYYYEGTALKDMAEVLGKSPAAIRKQKQRCVEKLRGLFESNV